MVPRERKPKEVRFGLRGGLVSWGSHICCLYESAAQRDEILLGFFAEGARNGDLLAYAAADSTWRDLPSLLAESEPKPAHLLRRDPRELSCVDGFPPPWIAPRSEKGPSQGDLIEEGRHVRSAVDMSWLAESGVGAGTLAAAEIELDCSVRERPWIALCFYDVGLFSNSNVVLILKTHPFVVGRGGLMPNSFYEGMLQLHGRFGKAARDGAAPRSTGESLADTWSFGA